MSDLDSRFFQDIDPDLNILNQIYCGTNGENSLYYTIDKYNQVFSRSNDLKIFHSNIRSFNANSDLFDGILDSFTETPEIFCLTETWFSTNNASLYNYQNFQPFHTVRSGTARGGGVSMYIKNEIMAVKLDDLSVCNRTIETCCVRLSLENSNLIVIAVYRPHFGSIQNFIFQLEEILTSSIIANNKVVLIGVLM